MAFLTSREIDVSIDDSQRRSLQEWGLTEDWLRTVVDRALRVALPADQAGQVSLLVTDDGTVQELNHKYRGLDEVTDVLSFSTTHAGHWEGDMPDIGSGDWRSPAGAVDQSAPEFLFPEDQPPPLGEVIVSFPQVQRQARNRHEPVQGELALLIIHGILHLVGHDHLEPDETARMQAKERIALDTLFPAGTNS